MRRGPGGPSVRRGLSQRPTCWEHGLATGPDGFCTLCKRSSRPAPESPAKVRPLARFAASVLGVIALAAVGTGLAAAFGLIEPELLVPDGLGGQPAPVVAARVQPVQPVSEPAPPPQPKTPAQLAAEQLAQQIAEQTRQLEAATAAKPSDQSALAVQGQADEPAAAQAEQRDRERHEEVAAGIEARALERARDKVSVVMYSTSWCPSCAEARKYMTDKQIAFTEHDIEQSPSARAIQRRLNPKGSIPTIDVEGAVLVGFSDESLEQMIDAAAHKHMR